MTIRPARPEDRDPVLALAPRLTQGVAPWGDHAAALRAARGRLAGSLDGGTMFVAEGDGGVLGVVSVVAQSHRAGDRDACIGEPAVAPQAARRGIGRALVTTARARAEERGPASVTLQTGSANATARAFYAALGFAEEEVRLTLPFGGRRIAT